MHHVIQLNYACRGTNYGWSNAWEIMTTEIIWYKETIKRGGTNNLRSSLYFDLYLYLTQAPNATCACATPSLEKKKKQTKREEKKKGRFRENKDRERER